MPVTLEITVNGSADPVGRYLTWTPYQAQVRVVASDLPGPLPVLLRNAADNVGGLYFRQAMTDEGEDELALQLPVDGSPVGFLLSGEFMKPSRDDGDAVLEAVVGGQVVAQVAFMVRVRKNAETLTDGERDRFVGALAALNNNGQGVFRGFRAMHTDDTVGRGARPRRLPALAPRLPLGPRARAAGDRAVGRSALLALRPGRATALLRRLPRGACRAS